MIHFALTIAAGLFLLWFAVVVLSLLAHIWPWVLGAIALFVVVVIANEHKPKVAALSLPGGPQTTHGPVQTPSTLTLTERLRVNPPVTIKLAQGEAWLVSALHSDGNRLRVLVRFSPTDTTKSILRGSAPKALRLLQQPLCGPEGLLAEYHLFPASVSIISYENGVRVGEDQLPSTYCSTKAR